MVEVEELIASEPVDYHNLVRDQIPRIIEAGGGRPVTHVLDQAGYLAALRAKLVGPIT